MSATKLYIISPDADETKFTQQADDAIYVYITADETKDIFMAKLEDTDISQVTYVGLAFKLLDNKKKYPYFEYTAAEIQQKLDMQGEYDRQTARHQELTTLCSELLEKMENTEQTKEERQCCISENIQTYLGLLNEKNSLYYPRDQLKEIPSAFSLSMQFFSESFVNLLRGLKETAMGLTTLDLLVEGIQKHNQFDTLLQEDGITVTFITTNNISDDIDIDIDLGVKIPKRSIDRSTISDNTYVQPIRQRTIDPTKVLNI